MPTPQPPAHRKLTSLGCVLQPVVTPPEGPESSTKVVWYREDGHVRQHTMGSSSTKAGRPAARHSPWEEARLSP